MCRETGLKTVLEYEKSHFELQWRRKEALDSKAANLISLVGIIVGVYTAASSYLLDRMFISPWFYISSILFVIGIAFFLCAAYKGIRALGIREYNLRPDPRDFSCKWINKKESDTQIALVLALVYSSKRVSAMSDEQAKHLESGHRHLVCGLFLTLLFVLSLIFSKILN